LASDVVRYGQLWPNLLLKIAKKLAITKRGKMSNRFKAELKQTETPKAKGENETQKIYEIFIFLYFFSQCVIYLKNLQIFRNSQAMAT
jgi:hypothetical protein